MLDDAFIESVAVRTPAAGQNATRAVPSETWELIDMVRCTLIADANVANRFVSVDFLDGDDIIVGRIQSPGAVVAGQTYGFTFATRVGQVLNGGTNEQAFGLPDVMMPPGFKVRVAVGNIQAGDQLTAIRFHMRRYASAKWAPSIGSQPYQP